MNPPLGSRSTRARDAVGRGWLLDVAIVAVLAILALATGSRADSRVDAAVILLVVVPLLARRAWPLVTLAVVAFGAVATSVVTPEPWVQVAAVVVAGFTVGERSADRVRDAMFVLATGGLMTVGFVVQDADAVEVLFVVYAVLVPAWLAGDTIRSRRTAALARAAVAHRAVEEREASLRAAAAEERRQIARELHDGLAHAVSVMVIQAGAAREVVHRSPDQAEEAMRAVETTGRDAMAELRRFLGVLGADDEAGGVAPQPGIRELPRLVERVREAGLPASLEVTGDARPVAPSLDVAVFRIVQEALTNALRHAGRAATLVRVWWEPDLLRLEILDEGPGPDGARLGDAAAAVGPAPDGGRGITGMRERAVRVGGHLEAGPRVGGGYAVRAWIPLGPPPAGLVGTA